MRPDNELMTLPINQLTDEERERAILLVNQIDKRKEIAEQTIYSEKRGSKNV